MVKTLIYAVDTEKYSDKEAEEILNDEDKIEEFTVFNIEIIYEVNISTCFECEHKEKEITDIVWFLLHPTLRETINLFSARLGLASINLPYSNCSKE